MSNDLRHIQGETVYRTLVCTQQSIFSLICEIHVRKAAAAVAVAATNDFVQLRQM